MRPILCVFAFALLAPLGGCGQVNELPEPGSTATQGPVSICSLVKPIVFDEPTDGQPGGVGRFDGEVVHVRGNLVVGDPRLGGALVDPECDWSFVGVSFSGELLGDGEGRLLLERAQSAEQVFVGEWPTKLEIEVTGRYTAVTNVADQSGRIDVTRVLGSRQSTARSGGAAFKAFQEAAKKSQRRPCRHGHGRLREFFPCA